jgi:hypothetical protein
MRASMFVLKVVVQERPYQHVASAPRGVCAFGAPAHGSAGCGLDREPGPSLRARSRRARLLPRLLRETTRAASVSQDALES